MGCLDQFLCAAILLICSENAAIKNNPCHIACSPSSVEGGTARSIALLLQCWLLKDPWAETQAQHASCCAAFPVAGRSMRLIAYMKCPIPLHRWLLQGLLVDAPLCKLLCHPHSDWIPCSIHCLHGAFGATGLLAAAAGPAGGDTRPPGTEASAGGQLQGG